MPSRPRPRRLALSGARVQLANTVTDVVDVSQTGVLVRVGYELRPGSEWPLVLDLPGTAPVRVAGRVVRCEPSDVALPGGAALRGHYLLALTFVNPSPEAQTVLDQMCGAATETGEGSG